MRSLRHAAGSLILSAAAFALAYLAGASPGMDSTVKAAPKEVSSRFTEAVEPNFSSIEVTNAQGQRLAAIT